MMAPARSQLLLSPAPGVVLKLDPESDSEDSEPDGPDDPVIPSPEMDDVNGQKLLSLLNKPLPVSWMVFLSFLSESGATFRS